MALAGTLGWPGFQKAENPPASSVAVVKSSDRARGVRAAIAQLEAPHLANRHIYLKASFNSPDPYPATTHPGMLNCVVEALRDAGCGPITLVERSGMGSAQQIWRELGIAEAARRLGIGLLSLDDLPDPDWRVERLEGSHWKRGVEVPRWLSTDACVVQICGAKTHRFGGIFSASLKNSLGLVAKYSHDGQRYNYMRELHASADQRFMIAEVNQVYTPALVIMDAIEIMISGGPEAGDLASPGIIAAAADRVAIDAVAVCLLRAHGAGDPIRTSEVFDHDQLKRAAELNLGAGSAGQVRLLGADPESRHATLQIQSILTGVSDEKKP